MNEERKQRLIKAAPWIALPIVAVVAFAFGGWLLGGPESGTDGHEGHAHAAEEEVIWTCSMHPQIRQNEPGQCPICGMDLIPVQNDAGDDDARPERIALSERAKTRAQIRTTAVRRLGSGNVERRLLGRVDYDETTLRTVTAWIGGRIDRLRVRVTGEQVRRGQAIATLYSPEIYSAHQDLLSAKQQLARLSGSATPTAQGAAGAALEAARTRLRLLGVPRNELAAMENASRPSEQVPIRTPFGGTVIERIATEGTYVTTGAGLYRVANLAKLWVQLDAYESDLPILRVGQQVTLRVEALPGQDFTGRVTFVDPVLNARTRTARVRIEVENPDGQLRPGMFAEAIVAGESREAGEQPLVIPDTAPLFTGRRSVVYVQVPNTERPTYDARIVRLGSKMGDVYPVIAGLTEGERVVVHGAFTLDADLQIRGGLAMMTADDDTAVGRPYEGIVQLPEALHAPMAQVVSHYLDTQAALAGDNFDAAKQAAAALGTATDAVELPDEGAQGARALHGAWMPLARQLKALATHMGHANSLDEARPVFRDLSQQVATILRVFGNPSEETLRLAFCPMALGNEGAEWVQRSESIENPYFGASMHSCGEIHNSVTHGTYLPQSRESSTPARRAPAGGHQH